MLSQIKISPKSLTWIQDRKPVWSQLLGWDHDLALSWLSLSKEIENGPRSHPSHYPVTSTHPTMVTHRSLSWSWMIDSHPFRSMLVRPQIRLFQTLTTSSRSWVWSKGKTIQPAHYLIDLLYFLGVASNTQFRLAQIRVATSLHIMLQVCHRGKSWYKYYVTLWNDTI